MTTPICDALYDAGLKLGGFGEPFVKMEASFWNIVPGLIFLLVLLLVGWIVGKIVAGAVRKLLERIGFERAMEKIKISRHFRSLGFKSVAHFLAIFVFWFIFLIFLQIGLGALDIEIITDILAPIILIIPRALIAALLVVIGLYVGTLVANLVEKILNKSGLKETVRPIDKQIAGTGYTLFKALALIIKVWIILLFVQVAVDVLDIEMITQFINPIILFFPRIVASFFVVVIGLLIANYVVNAIRKWLDRTEIGKKLSKADKATERGGLSIMGLALIFVKAWILLIFVQIALDILAVDILTTFINPIILYFPRLLVAMLLIIIGLLVVELVLRIVHGLLDELEADKFIEPVDSMMKRPGLVMRVINLLIKVFIMLIFVDIAVTVLGITQITELVNTVILYLPNVFVAVIIVLLGLWFAGWLSEKILAMSKRNELPFPSLIANAIKFLVIFIVITMAIAQIGIELPILYVAFAIVLGAVMIGVGAGFGFGMKDISANIAGYIQVHEIVQEGDKIRVGEYSGEVGKITRYTTMVKDEVGKEHWIPNTYLVKNTVIKAAGKPKRRKKK